jgi:hypothetical protein
VPLWNKKLNVTGASYQTYDQLNTSSLDGAVLAVGSVSLACLSCHDGTQAMDNAINAPGSGGYFADGGGAGGLVASQYWIGVKTLASGPIPMLGTDLRNDHPVGIEYCGGGITGSGNTISGSCKDSEFIADTTTTTADGRTAVLKTTTINSNQIFWVDVDGNAGRGKGDIQLYTRDFSGKGGSASGPSVECGSCHDPHVESKGSDNIMFMRVTTAGSKICLSCHVK